MILIMSNKQVNLPQAGRSGGVARGSGRRQASQAGGQSVKKAAGTGVTRQLNIVNGIGISYI